MARRYKLAAVAGLAMLMLVVLLAGQALAQTGTPMPRGMMAGTAMPGGMMGGTPMPGGMMAGTAMPPGGMMGGMAMPGGMDDMMSGMMGMMMGGSGMGNGMMGMMSMSGGWSDPNAKPLTLDQAQAAAEKYISGLPDNAGASLGTMEIMEFANGFYVAVGDMSANTGAFEVLVDRYNGNVSPEPGPNMMWNTKYGMMSGQHSGMMGMMGLWAPTSGTPTVSAQQAQTYAQQFLAVKFPGAKLPEDMMSFPGYYTLDFEVNGQPAGMLSVNAYTGQVWYHTWHGQFLSERSSSSF